MARTDDSTAVPTGTAPRRDSSVLNRTAGLAGVLLMASAIATLGTPAPARSTGPDASVQAIVDAPTVETRPEPVTGADGDTAPTAPPPPAPGRIERTAAAPGEQAPAVTSNGVPESVLTAYRFSTVVMGRAQPDCHLPMTLLAAIGKVESGHARGGQVDALGTTLRPILGPVLAGGSVAAIRDTDGGRLDGDRSWDRAVGPMQFIPGTWVRWATDGNGDGRADPHNIWDASLASGRYLCANGRDLATAAGMTAAILSYNRSTSYLRLVQAWMAAYNLDTSTVPDSQTPTPPGDPAAAPPPPAAPVAPAPEPGPPSAPPSAAPPSSTPPPTSPPTAEPGLPLPLPILTDPMTGLTCTVDNILDLGLGLIGGLLGLAPAPPLPICPVPPPA
ncbi:lytic transglycosylase domain-containing protein [Actinokineospora sp.]|uniref:lytic transglycosylase domain-containing protein n=1 Tax=Actinokineospora sp. TaxID=1872133 RepID=UPI004037D456